MKKKSFKNKNNNRLNFIFISYFINKQMSSVNKIIEEIIGLISCEIKKENTREKLESEVLSPIIDYILCQIKPYILGTCVFLVTITILIISIIFLIILKPTK
mgnify:CR=1 FL=1|jgi:hypothetical protein